MTNQEILADGPEGWTHVASKVIGNIYENPDLLKGEAA